MVKVAFKVSPTQLISGTAEVEGLLPCFQYTLTLTSTLATKHQRPRKIKLILKHLPVPAQVDANHQLNAMGIHIKDMLKSMNIKFLHTCGIFGNLYSSMKIH